VNGLLFSSIPVLVLHNCKVVGGLKTSEENDSVKTGVVVEAISKVPLSLGLA
jgi:hypothetical protein